MKPIASKMLLIEKASPAMARDPELAGMQEASAKWPVLQHVPVRMTVKIPLPGISLRGLRGLSVGAVIASDWAAAEEVPLYASNVALSWCEFEVVDGAIAVRLTRLG